MKAEATVVLAGVGWLLAGCTSPVCQPGYVTMVPSTADEDVTGRNNFLEPRPRVAGLAERDILVTAGR